MKIICDRQALCDAASHIARIVSSKANATEALKGILISAQDGVVTLSGYDLEIGVTKQIEARVERAGSVILSPAQKFCDIVRHMSEETVTLNTDERLICEISSGRANLTLNGIDAVEFPELPNVNEGVRFQMPGAVLQSMVRQTIFCVAQSDAKPVHTGILYEIKDRRLRLVAVDGYRLAVRTEPIDCAEDCSFIVPSKAMAEVTKIITGEEDPVEFTVAQRHIIFRTNGYCVISRLLEGDFLDYNKAIPKSVTTRATVSAQTMLDTIERISLLIVDRLKTPVRCILEDDLFKATCTTEIGRANDEFPIRMEGERIEIGFNSRYLSDALKNAECDEVLLELGGPLAPMILRPTEGDAFLFLVLPVRLKSEN